MRGSTDSRIRWFEFRAAAPDGSIRDGCIPASGAPMVSRRLEGDGLAVLHVLESEDPDESLGGASIRMGDLAVAFRNLATLLAAGVPINQALTSSRHLVSSGLAVRLDEVRRLVEEGHSLGEAMAAFPVTFPGPATGTIIAGERGSRLAEGCSSAADQLERESELRAEVRSALAYPLLILMMGIGTVVVLGGVVVPRFAVILGDMGAELPPLTSLLLRTSALVQSAGLPVAIGVASAALVVHRALASPFIRRRWHAVLLRLPLVGPIRRSISSARICAALGAMISTGMPLLASLAAASPAAGDLEVRARLDRVRDDVAEGQPLGESLLGRDALDPVAAQLIRLGEASGSLGEMTERAGEMSRNRGTRALKALVRVLEPALVILLGIIVATVAAALLQAVYSIRPVL